jgi:hypothetical protein
MKGRFFLLGVVLCICSCSLEEDSGYYSDSFGVVRHFSDNTPYIESDEKEILIPNQSISAFVGAGDRVWISYTIEQENARRDTLTVSPYRITRIESLSLQNESKLKESGIDLWTAWIAQGFLTFEFRIRPKDPEKLKEHEYALVASQKEIADTLFINFRHDDGGDNYGVLCRTAVTLNLDSLKISSDSVVLAVDYKNLDGIKQTEYRMYKRIQQ